MLILGAFCLLLKNLWGRMQKTKEMSRYEWPSHEPWVARASEDEWKERLIVSYGNSEALWEFVSKARPPIFKCGNPLSYFFHELIDSLEASSIICKMPWMVQCQRSLCYSGQKTEFMISCQYLIFIIWASVHLRYCMEILYRKPLLRYL